MSDLLGSIEGTVASRRRTVLELRFPTRDANGLEPLRLGSGSRRPIRQ